jgi:hypothetical protein
MLAISKSLKNELRFIIFDEPPPGWDAAAVLENGTVVLTGSVESLGTTSENVHSERPVAS